MAAALAAAAPKKTVVFRVYRHTPESGAQPYMEDFEVDTGQCGPMVLDALTWIKAKRDPSLSFRRACREGVCGSCALNINGRNGLACLQRIADHGRVVTVRPLPHFRVLRDLVVDMTRFFDHHAAIRPWLEPKHSHSHTHDASPASASASEKQQQQQQKPHRQSAEERRALDGLYECLLCGCCSGACPEYWWSSDSGGKFLGPAALQQALRWIVDSRDGATQSRIDALRNDPDTAYKCHTILNCTAACPKSLNPGRSVNVLRKILDDVPRV